MEVGFDQNFAMNTWNGAIGQLSCFGKIPVLPPVYFRNPPSPFHHAPGAQTLA